ncbi:MAG: HAMP domain-containing sensor histidine kinase [Cyanobacteriota bacterium]
MTPYTIYDAANILYVFQTVFVCGICNFCIYLYDRLQSSEFEAKRQLRLLLHALAHDLKTPIAGTAIVLQNFLAQKSKTDDKAKDMIMIPVEKLGKLINSHQRQISLIDAILQIHQHETYTFSLQRQPVDFQRLCADVIADLQEHFQDHHVEVVNQVRLDLPSVWGDPTQLWRVLTNLMTNAIQHNPEGIRLVLDASIIDASAGQNEALSGPTPAPPIPRLRCSVQDNGSGIPLEHQPTLFDLYWRNPKNPYAPGLGLGLYLCRHIIEAHGGEIGVSNAKGQGAIFWFTVPLAPQTSPARRATTAA